MSILCASCSSASMSGAWISAWGCWVDPGAREGDCVERELPSAPPPLPFGVPSPSTPDPSTSCCCSREGKGHSQGRRPDAGQQLSLLELRCAVRVPSSEVRGLDSRTLSWAHSSSGGLCGRGDAFCTPSSSSALASSPRPPSSFLCLLLPLEEPLTPLRFFLDFFPPREAMSPFLPDHRSARQPEGRCRQASGPACLGAAR